MPRFTNALQHFITGMGFLNVVVEKLSFTCLQVGLDSKAVLEAWNAIHKKHSDMPVVIITADAGEAFLVNLTQLLCVIMDVTLLK